MLRILLLTHNTRTQAKTLCVAFEYIENTGSDLDMSAFSSGAVEAHPTLEYQKIKGDKKYVDAPWL